MVLHDYKCKECGHTLSVDPKVIEGIIMPPCGRCGGQMKRIYYAPAVHFKGSGFTKTTA